MTEGTSAENHILKMIEWIEKLTNLGIVLEDNLCFDLILQSLPDSFSHFIMNFNMSKFEMTLPKLLNMLREAESANKKEKSVLYIGDTKKKRKASKTHKKGKGKERPDFHDNTWVLDTGSAYHICNSLQVLARSRRLARCKMDLKMGNGARVAIVAVGEYKSEAFEKFRDYKNEVDNQIGKSIKTLRSDRGGEYLSTEFTHFLRDNGILSQWTPPYTPQLNRVLERKNRTLLDMVRSMMSFADLLVSF
ncbi:hypothetical protein OPV22_002589 [Ensete ventricosum]|uniref:Integrase catalytic domain-containing protein n=1 Tax=Ensete ventricosum TaxID=4639 RepID=A0AAV8RYI0_ENSVE|nr:hypothetical protein OPV22_002589 [Ensete ventricosum]